ncbi:MAG: hypothetical protein Q4D02_01730 [Clostridia bacterium]|nr:hypothetical protein [Clostridia bacterium]
MKTLNINIDDNIIKIDKKYIASGTFNYIKCHFSFTKEWNEYDKIAIFTANDKTYKKALVDNECIIPQEIAEEVGKIYIGVYGNKIENDVLESRCTSNLEYFRISRGAYEKDALESEALADISSYELYINKMNEILEETKQALDDTIQIKTDIQGLVTSVIQQIKDNVKAIENKAVDNIDKEYQSVLERLEEAYVAKENELNKNYEEKKAEIDKAVTEAIEIKTSVEEDKSAVEQAKEDTIVARDNTLEAKEEVESSLENEREISDNKYARALKTTVQDVNFAQVYTENSKLDMFVIKGEQLIQETREGYNLFNPNAVYPITQSGIVVNRNEDGSIMINGTATENGNIRLDWGYSQSEQEAMTGKSYSLKIVTSGEGSLKNVGLKYAGNSDRLTMQNIETGEYSKVATYTKQENDTGILYNALYFLEGTIFNNYTIYITLAEGTEVKEYERYGESPSLDFPSEIENIVQNISIQNSKENILYIDNLNYKPGYMITKNGITFTVQNDLGLKCVGAAEKNTNLQILVNEPSKKKIQCKNITGKLYAYIQGSAITGARIVIRTIELGFLSIANAGVNIKESVNICNVYAEILAGNTVDCIIYPQLTYEKAEEYMQYDGYRKELVLPEDCFNGAIGGYKDRIYKDEDNLWKLEKVIKKYNFTGDETLNKLADGEDYNEYSVIIAATPAEYFNALSNYFSDKENNRIVLVKGTPSVAYIRIPIKYSIDTIEKLKALFKEKNDAGEPVYMFYPLDASQYEYITLSQENQVLLNNLELQTGLNNISIDAGTFDLTCNEDLQHFLDEKFGNIESRLSSLEANQVSQIGGE